MLAIYQYFGYKLPMKERFTKIKAAGFDAVGLWSEADWSHDEWHRRDQAILAREAGLEIMDAHAPRIADFVDAIWTDTLDGEATYETYKRTIHNCAEVGLKNLIIHTETYHHSPPPNALGILRIQKLVETAENHGITLALEHIRNHRYLIYIYSHIESPNLRFCYDSGHQNCNEPEVDLLALFGDKLAALHLHDNNGRHDQHRIPFTGTVNWPEKMAKISALGYQGPITLECTLRRRDETEAPPVEEWLQSAFAAAKRLKAIAISI